MKRLIFTLLILVTFFPFSSKSQEADTLVSGLYALFENSLDQEGMFSLPQVRRTGFIAGSPVVNQRRLQTALKNNDYPVVVTTAVNLAWIEFDQGNFEKSIAYFNSAIEAQEKIDSENKGGLLLLQKGFVQYRSLDYDNALLSFNASLEKLQEQRSVRAIPVASALTGQTWLVKKDFSNAEKYFRSAYDDFKKLNDRKGVSRTAVQLAEIAIRKEDYRDAEKYLFESRNYFVQVKDVNGEAMVLRDLGIIKFKNGDYDAAIRDFRESHSLSNQLSVARLLKNTYLKLFTLKSLAGDHEASNAINILYVQLRDSIDNVERSRVINSQLTRRELLEKESIDEMLRKADEISYHQLTTQQLEANRMVTEAEIERLEKEKIIEDLNMAKRISDQANLEREDRIRQLTEEKSMQELALSKKELEVSRAQTLRNTLVIVFIFTVVTAFLLYNRYRNKSKSHRQLDVAYKELSETHQKLLSAQEQLVHAQKMASLGQLTAGIAHEIQNPLNFVNNFSELSIELIEELREPNSNMQEILGDLQSNLQKINTHGKRADKIVKGMLLHSRTGQVEKQPADLNKMIDELLELSYHGNRSRDNNFTAEIIRNFEPDLPMINVVTQDISRVLINLFNNAFYAVGQRARSDGKHFKATVGVSTRKLGESVLIKIRDNGTGIPETIRKKIFDPFFTTKPAGEGTGLGLSLSYDVIVKGHGGALAVNSESGSFTEFVISLPLN